MSNYSICLCGSLKTIGKNIFCTVSMHVFTWIEQNIGIFLGGTSNDLWVFLRIATRNLNTAIYQHSVLIKPPYVLRVAKI